VSPSHLLRALGRALMTGLSGAGLVAGGSRWYVAQATLRPEPPVRDEPPAGHPDRMIPLKALPWSEASVWQDLERRLD